jgi:hypothetical protein
MNLNAPSKSSKSSSLRPKQFAVPLLLMAVLVVIIALPILTGGNSSDRDNTPPQSQVQVQSKDQGDLQAAAAPLLPTSTSDPDSTPPATATSVVITATVMIATHAAYATNVALHRQEIRTAVALTHAPTITPGRPPSRPSPTPMMGMLPGCGNTSAYGPQAYSCWRGLVNGQIVEVYAGREGSNGDPTQGIVRVHVRGQEGADDVYQTPQRVGAVQIASVDGTEFTLETVDLATPQVFVFDLDSREWVSP